MDHHAGASAAPIAAQRLVFYNRANNYSNCERRLKIVRRTNSSTARGRRNPFPAAKTLVFRDNPSSSASSSSPHVVTRGLTDSRIIRSFKKSQCTHARTYVRTRARARTSLVLPRSLRRERRALAPAPFYNPRLRASRPGSIKATAGRRDAPDIEVRAPRKM